MRRLALVIALIATPAAAQPEAAVQAQAPLKGLLGSSEAGVRTRLGEPDVARREDQGAMWTYRRPDCALYVYFRAAGREGLRVVGASTGPRRRGEPAPGVEACLAEPEAQAPRNSSRDGQRSATGHA
jgi:hypothetical protein